MNSVNQQRRISADVPRSAPAITEFNVFQRSLSRLRIGYLPIGFGLFTAVMAYLYLMQVIDPQGNLNTFSDFRRMLITEDYQFFSGSKGGFYIRIGQALEQRTEDQRFRFHNVTSGGGQENALKVASTAQSFGLVQEDTLSSTDYMRQHVRYITPLYLERLHIIYDHQKYTDLVEARQNGAAADDSVAENEPVNNGYDQSSQVTLRKATGSGAEDDVRYFFKHARISTGPVGSGSRIFARYLLTYCEITDYNDLGLSFDQALNRLDAGGDQKVDVIFTIAGAPLDTVQRVLQASGDQRFRLMSIDTTVIPELKEQYDLRLNKCDFGDKYPGGESVSTFGSWAFLIASRDVSDVVVSRTLQELYKAKDEIRRDMGIDDEDKFQLSEFNFYDTYTIGQSGSRWRGFRNLLLFLGFVAVVGTAVSLSLSWFISNINKGIYYREMTRTYEQAMEENWKLTWPEDDEEGFPAPVIHEDQKQIIDKLVTGISKLSGQAVRMRQAYNDGGLLSLHRAQLFEIAEDLRRAFQRHLARRLNEYYANYGEYEAVALRHYFTAGYLAAEDFHRLERKYGATRPEADTPKAESSPTPVKSPPTRIFGPGPRIFISYRRAESSFAVGRIRERLVASFGKELIFQDLDIPAGRDFREYIAHEVTRCDVVLAVIGSDWLSIMRDRTRGYEEDYLHAELEAALDDDATTLIPVLLAPAQLPYEEELPVSIRRLVYLQAMVVRPDPDFHASVDRLIEAVCQAVGVQSNASIGEEQAPDGNNTPAD